MEIDFVDMADNSSSCCYGDSVEVENPTSCYHKYYCRQRICSDFTVSGPASHSSTTSPSQGPCSPESSFKCKVLESDFSLGNDLTDALSDSNNPSNSTYYSYFDRHHHLIPKCLLEDMKASQQQCLEQQLRSACSNALSLCAFPEDRLERSNRCSSRQAYLDQHFLTPKTARFCQLTRNNACTGTFICPVQNSNYRFIFFLNRAYFSWLIVSLPQIYADSRSCAATPKAACRRRRKRD